MIDDVELGFQILRVAGCVGTLVVLVVAVAASIAAARIRHTKGPWLLALGLWGLGGLAVVGDAMGFAEVDREVSLIVYAGFSGFGLVLNLLLVVGMAMLRPAPPEETSP